MTANVLTVALTVASMVVAVLVSVVVTLSCDHRPGPRPSTPGTIPTGAVPFTPSAVPPEFRSDVQPVVAARCVVCHSCYDAPCQLKLSSTEGLDRGGTKARVYQGTRTTAVPTTRLFIDATSTAQWREQGFHSVRDAGASESVLSKMLQLGHDNPPVAGQPLPKQYDLGLNRELTCPTEAEFDRYVTDHPGEGMPYGTAPLSDEEYNTLATWAADGAPFDTRAVEPSPTAAEQIADWEAYLNRDGNEAQLVARYIYEHWFLGHLYFADEGAAQFYRLVRSSTPPGEPIAEIATRRPIDDPGTRPFYRLRPLDQVFVRKTHFLFALSPERLAGVDALFFGGTPWNAAVLPSYAPQVSTNPFVTFASIPADARYQFLLDDAKFYIENFVQGPSCRGQVALNVLQDHFYIAFIDPQFDLSVRDPSYMAQIAQSLDLPATDPAQTNWDVVIGRHYGERRTYVKLRNRRYNREDPKHLGLGLDAIWDGDGDNRSAFLTVMRHNDNASVRTGFHGAHPKTAMFMDYPVLERLYYNLVANFDVYGDVGHQIVTRIYMDYLRVESEMIYLSFLPKKGRNKLRNSWYKRARLKAHVTYPRGFREADTRVVFRTSNPAHELFDQLIADRPDAAGQPLDTINRCDHPPCDRPTASPLERQAERVLQTLAGRPGKYAQHFPELAFVQIRPADGGDPIAYTIARTTEHRSVAYLVGDLQRRDEDADTLAILRGYEGAYPNYFFSLSEDELPAFASQVRGIRTSANFVALVDTFGVRRTDARFWALLDWFHEDFAQRRPTEASLFDINRMEGPTGATGVRPVLQEHLGELREQASDVGKGAVKDARGGLRDIRDLLPKP